MNENEWEWNVGSIFFTGKLSKSHKISFFSTFNERCNMHKVTKLSFIYEHKFIHMPQKK